METWQALLCSPTALSQQKVPSNSLSLIFVNGKSWGNLIVLPSLHLHQQKYGCLQTPIHPQINRRINQTP